MAMAVDKHALVLWLNSQTSKQVRSEKTLEGRTTMTSLDDQVLVALRRIIRATDIHSRGLAKKTGLTTPQLVILRAVADASAPTVSEIALAVSLSQATVTTLLNKLM